MKNNTWLGRGAAVAICLWMASQYSSRAMSAEDFVHFLSNPPAHGYVRLIQTTWINPEMAKEDGVTNRLVQTYEYMWNDSELLCAVAEGNMRQESGTFKGLQWEHVGGQLQRYVGTNTVDAARNNTPLRAGFAKLENLGINKLVRTNLHWDGNTLDAELDHPEVRSRTGTNPRMRGHFVLSPENDVARLEYILYLPGHENEDTLRFVIDYRFNGQWGRSFPSYIGVRTTKLLYEQDIEEYAPAEIPSESRFDPSLLFSNSDQFMLSNNTAFFAQNDKQNKKKLIPLVARTVPPRNQTPTVVFRTTILAAIFLPFAVWGWVAVKRKRKNSET